LSLEIIVPLAVTYKQSIHNSMPFRTSLKVNNIKKKYTKALHYPEEKKYAKMPVLMMPV